MLSKLPIDNSLLSRGVKQSFPNFWTGYQKTVLLEILVKTAECCGYRKVPLTLGFGSLLGHVRHGGQIPWCDIVELTVDIRYATLLHTIFNELEFSGVKQCPFWGGHYLYTVHGEMVPHEAAYRWPAVIIRYYHNHANYCRYMLPGKNWKWPVSSMFPLVPVEFEGVSLFAPNNPEDICDINYGNNWRTMCRTSLWSHKRNERGADPPEHCPVSVMSSVYKFVT